MIANLALGQCELEGIEAIVRSANSPLGTEVSTPAGAQELTEERRVELAELAGKIQRCCRNIDDILFIDLKKEEVKWAIEVLYAPAETGLELTEECATWLGDGRVHYLDMSVGYDEHSFKTDLFDKRTELTLNGMMGKVRRFPHAESKLSRGVLYNTLTGFLHRAHCVVTRWRRWAEHAAGRAADHVRYDYEVKLIKRKLMSFIDHHYLPVERRAAMAEMTRRVFERKLKEDEEEKQRRRYDATRRWSAAERAAAAMQNVTRRVKGEKRAKRAKTVRDAEQAQRAAKRAAADALRREEEEERRQERDEAA